jgi:hypothetical protein
VRVKYLAAAMRTTCPLFGLLSSKLGIGFPICKRRPHALKWSGFIAPAPSPTRGTDPQRAWLRGAQGKVWDRGEASRGWREDVLEATSPLNTESEGRESLGALEAAGQFPRPLGTRTHLSHSTVA